MDELRNLQQMASLASGRFNQYDGEDFVLPHPATDGIQKAIGQDKAAILFHNVLFGTGR